MALLARPLRALDQLTRGTLAEVRSSIEEIVDRAGANLRPVYFQSINAVVGILGRAGITGDVRGLAADVVRYNTRTVSAAAQLQNELERGGARTSIPTTTTLPPGEFRLLASVDVVLPGEDTPRTVYVSLRTQGIPSLADIDTAFAGQIESLADDYEITLRAGVNVGQPVFQRVEAGGYV